MDVTFALQRCTLRPWQFDDLGSLVQHANDERVAATVRDLFPSPYTHEDGERWLTHATGEGRGTSLAIEVGGSAVGGVGAIVGQDVHRIRAEIGYWLGHAFWNQGVMSEAVQAYSDHLLQNLGYLRLEAPVFATNPASARVLQKAGYALESTQFQAAIKLGRVIDVWMYVRLA